MPRGEDTSGTRLGISGELNPMTTIISGLGADLVIRVKNLGHGLSNGYVAREHRLCIAHLP